MNADASSQMEILVKAVQPHCDELIIAAMTCSHAGSMTSTLISKFLGGAGAPGKSFPLPNPVFIAVGSSTVYAFAYKPRGSKFKIKKEVARWPRMKMSVSIEKTGVATAFVLTSGSGESFHLEIPTLLGGRELADLFLDALGKGK